MYFYAASTVRPDVFGSPFPASGVRVVFDETLLAAYGPRESLPVVHRPSHRQGLVVYWSPLDVITWPCRLWQVDDLEDPVMVSPHPFYLRCAAFTVIEELPGWQVFGPHGYTVAGIEQKISTDLTPAHVDAIFAQDGTWEWQTYLAVMRRWHDQVGSTPHEGRMLSPIGNGTAVVRDAVDLVAARTDPALFDWVDDASEYPVLADPRWRAARQATTAAALALGAPELLRDNDFDLLTARWRTAFPTPDRRPPSPA